MNTYGLAILVLLATTFPNLAMHQEQQTPLACCICQEPLANQRIITLSCHKTHIFHKECLDGWADINPTCPFDRKPIKISFMSKVRNTLTNKKVILGSISMTSLLASTLYIGIMSNSEAHNPIPTNITSSSIIDLVLRN